MNNDKVEFSDTEVAERMDRALRRALKTPAEAAQAEGTPRE